MPDGPNAPEQESYGTKRVEVTTGRGDMILLGIELKQEGDTYPLSNSFGPGVKLGSSDNFND